MSLSLHPIQQQSQQSRLRLKDKDWKQMDKKRYALTFQYQIQTWAHHSRALRSVQVLPITLKQVLMALAMVSHFFLFHSLSQLPFLSCSTYLSLPLPFSLSPSLPSSILISFYLPLIPSLSFSLPPTSVSFRTHLSYSQSFQLTFFTCTTTACGLEFCVECQPSETGIGEGECLVCLSGTVLFEGECYSCPLALVARTAILQEAEEQEEIRIQNQRRIECMLKHYCNVYR